MNKVSKNNLSVKSGRIVGLVWFTTLLLLSSFSTIYTNGFTFFTQSFWYDTSTTILVLSILLFWAWPIPTIILLYFNQKKVNKKISLSSVFQATLSTYLFLGLYSIVFFLVYLFSSFILR